MKYLVDANVLSEPTKPSPEPRVIEWLRTHEGEFAVDPIILGELRFGILLLPKGESAQPWSAGSTPASNVYIASRGRPKPA